MKSALSSMELHFLVAELQSIVGSRLDKAYQGPKERKRDLTFQLHQKDEGKKLLRIILPGLIYIADKKPSYDIMPGPFATFLRKHVGNSRIIEIRQKGFERIVELVLENKDGKFTLVLELLPPGNALLLNPQGKIINLLEPQRTSSRTLRGGAVYEPPPAVFDTKNATPQQIAERLLTSDKDSIVKTLAMDLGLGGEYAEEACVRAGVEKSRADLRKEDLMLLANVVAALFDEKINPSATHEEAFPIALKTKSGVKTASFSAAIESIVPDTVVEKKEAVVQQKKDKVADVVKQQEAASLGLRKSSDENQRKGELLYEHYREVELLLQEINELHKTLGWPETKARMKARGIIIDEQKGEASIELE